MLDRVVRELGVDWWTDGRSAAAAMNRKSFTRRLLVRPLHGRFALTEAALDAAERLLPTYRGPDGDHEGILFLLGYEIDDLTVFTAVLAPDADHGCGHVVCSREQILDASRAARANGLALLGQLHSHPHDSTYHSPGDDDLVLMPFEGMISLVAPHYARFGLRPLHSLGVHQYQDGKWVVADPAGVRSGFRIVPTAVDLR